MKKVSGWSTALFLGTAVGVAHGQGLNCGASDVDCFQRDVDQACHTAESTTASCDAALERVAASPARGNLDMRLMVGAGNFALSELANEPAAKATYRNRARDAYTSIVSEHPTNASALVGLATLAETSQERIAVLRRALVANPTDLYLYEALSETLSRTGNSSEAAALTEQAYELESQQEKKWNLAEVAVLRYEDAGQTPQADAMRNRVRQDYGLKGVSAQLAHPESLDPDQLTSMLTSVCSLPIAYIVGATTCLDSLKTSADLVSRTRDNRVAVKLADGASTAISSSVEIEGMLNEADPNWRKRFKEMTRGFITAGAISQKTLSAYGAVVSDPKERVDDMKAAAARFPDNGELAAALGLAHLDYGNRDDAIRSLSRAKQLLPPDRQQSIDQVLNEATALPH
jgi:tetratricopeptide (TPR) repeat protein